MPLPHHMQLCFDFDLNFLTLIFYKTLLNWCISVHNLKYLVKLIKCLEMGINIKLKENI